MYLFYKHIKNKSIHIVFISFAVYIFVNTFENYIHYNIGRNHDNTSIKLYSPNKVDWFKIIGIMFIFALIQGVMTYMLE
jgi:hypothetical protein